MQTCRYTSLCLQNRACLRCDLLSVGLQAKAITQLEQRNEGEQRRLEGTEEQLKQLQDAMKEAAATSSQKMEALGMLGYFPSNLAASSSSHTPLLNWERHLEGIYASSAAVTACAKGSRIQL